MKASRDALSYDRVLHAALALVDAHGLAALSMRRLGAELGVEAMSLYRHIPNKDALLDAMVDAIVQTWVETAAPPTDDWRSRLASIMHRAHRSLLERPWAVELITTRPRIGVARLRYAEAITAALIEGGFTPQLAHHGLHIVDGTIMGFTAQQTRRPTADALGERVQALYDGELRDEYPSISLTIREHHDHDEEYALMVDLVLEGLARLRDGQAPRRSQAGAAYVLSST